MGRFEPHTPMGVAQTLLDRQRPTRSRYASPAYVPRSFFIPTVFTAGPISLWLISGKNYSMRLSVSARQHGAQLGSNKPN
jgi:hypothetical protein